MLRFGSNGNEMSAAENLNEENKNKINHRSVEVRFFLKFSSIYQNFNHKHSNSFCDYCLSNCKFFKRRSLNVINDHSSRLVHAKVDSAPLQTYPSMF